MMDPYLAPKATPDALAKDKAKLRAVLLYHVPLGGRSDRRSGVAEVPVFVDVGAWMPG